MEKVDSWFVIRYRTLTARLKQQLDNCKLEIFHKYMLATAKRGAKIVAHEVPVLSGYIFVHASFDEVKAWALLLGLHMMRDPFWEATSSSEEDQFLHIAHSAMVPFMRAVEMKANELVFTDTHDYNVEKDDRVRFVTGKMAGAEGYLKPGKGRTGGTVIVPLGPLCYKIDARQEDLTVVAFAKGNRHAKDCIIDARPTVDAAFKRFKYGKKVNETTRQKLTAFVSRYGETRLNTNTQKAQHYALLYRIHTILGNRDACRVLREMIDKEVIPDLVRRRDAAQKRGNADAAAKHSELLEDIKETKRNQGRKA